MIYKVFTHADVGRCPFHRPGSDIPDKLLTESRAKKFCSPGCSVLCRVFFILSEMCKVSEADSWPLVKSLIIDDEAIVLYPVRE